MGLADRHYMRESPFEMRRSATVMLLIVLGGVFLVQTITILFNFISPGEWSRLFGLSLSGMEHKRFWQLFTFQFLHDWPIPLHLLFNGLALYFFGRTVEETLGRTSFLKLYFLSGFVGGVLQILAAWLLPNYSATTAVVGASAGIAGIIAAYATLFPERETTVFFYFFPVTLRAKYFFWGMLALSIYGTLIPFGGTAHAAHLGGALMGLALIRWGNNPQSPKNWKLFRDRQRKRELVKAASIKIAPWQSAIPEAEDIPPGEFISREVDPILDKISQHGIQSLTEKERKILEAARKKMANR